MLSNIEVKKQMEQGNIVIQNLSRNALQKPKSVEIRLGNVLYGCYVS